MKKKIVVIAAILSIFGAAAGLKSGDAYAADCTVTMDANACYNAIKDDSAVKSACYYGGESACKAAVKNKIKCAGGMPDVACNSRRDSLTSTVSKLVQTGGNGNTTTNNTTNSGSGNAGGTTGGSTNTTGTTGGGSNTNSSSNSSSSSNSGSGNSGSGEKKQMTEVKEGDCTSILPAAWCKGDNGIESVIRLVISIMTGAVVVAGTVGVIICGVMWMTARENENQVATAKRRILDIVIGVVAWILLSMLANLFIPKGSEDIDKDISEVGIERMIG